MNKNNALKMNMKCRSFFGAFIFVLFFICIATVYQSRADVKEPELSTPKTELTVGEKVTFSVSDATDKIKWSSSKKSIASVSAKGVVTAKKPGKATITASIGEVKLSKIITVTKTGIVLHMFDVGQGDAFLFQVNGRNILVDTGQKSEYPLLLSQLNELNIKKIDILILSHIDSDHIGSATDIISDFDVSVVYMPKTDKDTSEAKKLYETVLGRKISVVYPEKDDEIFLGYGAEIDVLAVDTKSDSNASSIVFRLDYYDNSFLMTGDAPAEVENRVMEDYDLSDIEVLKVAHHGSDYSSPILYLKTISPQYALISCGQGNAYGHPNKTVLNRLEKYADSIFRTDLDGHVVISGTGKKLNADKAAVPESTDRSISEIDNSENEINEEQYIGNVKSKAYHRTTCKNLPLEKNRIYFDTKENAEKAGYRPCQNCKP